MACRMTRQRTEEEVLLATLDDTQRSDDGHGLGSLGKKLRRAREDSGLSQAAVAAHLGIPRASISAIENDKRKVSSLELERFAQLFKRSVLSLLGTDIGRGHMQTRRVGTTFAMLADGTDLTGWADQRVAQSELPRVIRQLVLATVTRIGRISFPADEGIQMSGWDGYVEAPEGNAYVPDGISVWELGVNAQVKSKADADYAKRTNDAGDLDTKAATFIFVTSRRWGGKDEWVAGKRKEGRWRDVRAYDADDLATWLELAPSVHLRLSLLMGKSVDGAEDLPHWWDVWSSATRPPFTAELVIAGRKAEADRVRQWLQQPPSLTRSHLINGRLRVRRSTQHGTDGRAMGTT
jgi:transcriptional regulator with XRE-family HTH domain